MNENTTLENYIKAEKEVKKFRDDLSLEHIEVATKEEMKIKADYAWILLIPIIVHIIMLSTSGGSSLIDKLWYNPSPQVFHLIEDFDHLYVITGIVFFLAYFCYVAIVDSKLTKNIKSSLDYRPSFNDDDMIGITAFITLLLLGTSAFACMNRLNMYEGSIKMNSIIFLLATLTPVIRICWLRINHSFKGVPKKKLEIDKKLEMLKEKYRNKSYLKGLVLSDPSAMREVLKEYEKPAFEYHPDHEHFTSLVEGMIEKNEEAVEKYKEMKKLKSIYERVYEDKIEITEPVGIINE